MGYHQLAIAAVDRYPATFLSSWRRGSAAGQRAIPIFRVFASVGYVFWVPVQAFALLVPAISRLHRTAIAAPGTHWLSPAGARYAAIPVAKRRPYNQTIGAIAALVYVAHGAGESGAARVMS